MAVHSILPPELTAAVDDVLRAVIGPFRSRAVAEAIEATAPAGPVGVAEARRAAQIAAQARDLAHMRALGPFDEHGHPVDPLVRFERYDA